MSNFSNSSINNSKLNSENHKTKNSAKSIYCLCVYKILSKCNENSGLTKSEINKTILDNYNLTLDRKAVSRIVNTMEDGNLGIYCKNGRYYMSKEESYMDFDLTEEELMARFALKTDVNDLKSIAPVYMYEIINAYSETMPVSQKNIIKTLEDKYEISLNRCTVGRHLHTLEDYNFISSSSEGWFAA